MPFEVAIADSPEVPTYIEIAEKALHLKELNMNPNQIAVALKVDRTTVLQLSTVLLITPPACILDAFFDGGKA